MTAAAWAFLVWRNVAWFLTNGSTIGPLDPTFLIFGGTNGTLGAQASWIIGAILAAATVATMCSSRRAKQGHGFPVKPVWAEVLIAAIAVAVIMGLIWALNSYLIPERRLVRMFEAREEIMPEGFTHSYGLPISVFVLIAVAIAMTLIAKRTRFGRYIFAAGGNPDAAALAGINTRFLTVKIFALMGALCAASAVVASARLSNHTNDIGTLDELRVIAAAVIGGTALWGWRRHDLRRHPGRADHAEPAIGHGHDRDADALPEHRGRRGPRPRRIARHPLSQTGGSRLMTTPLVEMRNMSISFGGIQAVDNVSVDLYRGEVVGLQGHNGAGKSTLIKMLSGAYRPDSGEIFINGQNASIHSPR